MHTEVIGAWENTGANDLFTSRAPGFQPGSNCSLVDSHSAFAASKIWRLKLLKYASVSVPGNTTPPAEERLLEAAAGDLKSWQSNHINLWGARGQCLRGQAVRCSAPCPPYQTSIWMEREEIREMDWKLLYVKLGHRLITRAWCWSQSREAAAMLDYRKSTASSCKTVTQLETTAMSVTGSDSEIYPHVAENKWFCLIYFPYFKYMFPFIRLSVNLLNLDNNRTRLH